MRTYSIKYRSLLRDSCGAEVYRFPVGFMVVAANTPKDAEQFIGAGVGWSIDIDRLPLDYGGDDGPKILQHYEADD